MRIIDRDIQFYEGQKARHISDLQRCEREVEPIHSKLAEQAEFTIRVLKAYRDLIDKYNTEQS